MYLDSVASTPNQGSPQQSRGLRVWQTTGPPTGMRREGSEDDHRNETSRIGMVRQIVNQRAAPINHEGLPFIIFLGQIGIISASVIIAVAHPQLEKSLMAKVKLIRRSLPRPLPRPVP